MHKAYSGLATSDDEQEEGGGEVEDGSEHGAWDKMGRSSSSSNRGSGNNRSRSRGGGGLVRRRRGGRSTSASPSSGDIVSEARPISGPAGEGLAGSLEGGEEERGRRREVTSSVARRDSSQGDDAAGPRRPRPGTEGNNVVTPSDGEGPLLPPGGAVIADSGAGGVDGVSSPFSGPPVSRARWSDVEEGAELLGEDGIWTNAAVEEGGDKEKESFWTSPDGFRHLLVTAVFLGLSYAIAMTLDDLGVILEVGLDAHT